MARIISIRLHGRGKTYQADPGKLDLRQGDPVLVEVEQGVDFAFCTTETIELPPEHLRADRYKIVRLATEDEEDQFDLLQMDETTALRVARQKVEELGLEMDVVRCEIIFDRKRMLFYFTAEGRVDFRELVKDLAAIFKTRIELRQIGVRDEARMVGALGCCGRELCCTSFLRDFHPVSIKMAKEQNLSMNPNKISGACGRLLCCLKFEQDAYVDARSRLPYKNDVVRCAQGEGTIESVNLLRETVTIRLERGDETESVTVPAAEVEVLRSAKKRKSAESKQQEQTERLGHMECPSGGQCKCPRKNPTRNKKKAERPEKSEHPDKAERPEKAERPDKDE